MTTEHPHHGPAEFMMCPHCRACWRVGQMFYSFEYENGVECTILCPTCMTCGTCISSADYYEYVDMCQSLDDGDTNFHWWFDELVAKYNNVVKHPAATAKLPF